MNETSFLFLQHSFTYHGLALLMVISWPLLLAIPALHTRLPGPRHLAIIPALLLAVFPGDVTLDLPRILFGTGFSIDGDVRWILLMSMAIWLTAATTATTAITTVATTTKSSLRAPEDVRANSFFMLTLAGNLGAILTTDLVGFFSFSTLMGYGFYGLLFHGSDKEVQRASRLYLIFLIIADLLLFETLLLAAFTTEDLRYESVRHIMAGAASSQLYIWITLIGFALKAGIWPAQLWLSAVCQSAHRSTFLLLGAAPIGMGLLGALRWLPLGEHTFYIPGTVMQLIGVAGILYAALRLFTHAPVKLLPVWISVAATSLFIAALGMGLTDPVLWRRYEYLAYPFIASIGGFITAAIFVTSRIQNKQPSTDFISQQEHNFYLWAERWIALIQRWTTQRLHNLQSLSHSLGSMPISHLQRALAWKAPEFFLTGWRTRIIWFVLLGLTLAWLAK